MTNPRELLAADHDRLERLAGGLLDAFEEGSQRDLRAAWSDFDSGLLAHFAVEERSILPLFDRAHPEEAASLRADHARLRRTLAELGVGVDLHLVPLATARDFIASLRAHARREEALLYPWAERKLDAEATAAVARGLQASPQSAIGELVGRLYPGSRVEEVQPLAPDDGTGDTRKVEGYGKPLRVTVRGPQGERRVLVFRTASSNIFGHDRRSDRAAEMLLSFDTFGAIPDHVRPLDVGAIGPAGRLLSLKESGEFYLLTSFAEGRMYSDHLRRVAAEGAADEKDVARCELLARWLVRLHARRIDEPDAYTRAVRDLLGHGEGIFGMADGYGSRVPAAPPERLRAIEDRCLDFRWRLRGRERRLRRIHGDFHPFNAVFSPAGELTMLDASRGCKGDPADDVTSMAINFVFFAIHRREAWPRGLGLLWRRFWDVYLRESGDGELLEVAAPWLAWRCLVVCSPRFYPDLPAPERDRILGLAERALAAPRFDPAWAEDLFR